MSKSQNEGRHLAASGEDVHFSLLCCLGWISSPGCWSQLPAGAALGWSGRLDLRHPPIWKTRLEFLDPSLGLTHSQPLQACRAEPMDYGVYVCISFCLSSYLIKCIFKKKCQKSLRQMPVCPLHGCKLCWHFVSLTWSLSLCSSRKYFASTMRFYPWDFRYPSKIKKISCCSLDLLLGNHPEKVGFGGKYPDRHLTPPSTNEHW